MSTKRIALVAALVLVGALTWAMTRPSLVHTTLNGHSITVNDSKVEVTLTDGKDFIIMPVNTNVKKLEILSADESYDFTALNEFIDSIDTLEPKEWSYENEDLNINIIVSDDLR